MKKDFKADCIATIKEDDNFRNDGNGRVFQYAPSKGIWHFFRKPLHGRQRIEQLLKERKIPVTDKDAKELYECVRDSIDFHEPLLAENSSTTLIVCKNGIVDLSNGELQPHKKELFLRWYLDFQYIKDVKIPGESQLRPYLATLLGVPTMRLDNSPKFTVLLEILMYCISRLPNAKKAFILHGPGDIGKSVLLKLLIWVVGKEGTTALTWDAFGMKYHEAMIKDCRLVVSDEMSCKPLTNLAALKTIISGGRRTSETKFGAVEDYDPDCVLISAANNMPQLAEPDVGGAFADRLIIIPLGNTPVEKKDHTLAEQLWEKDRDVLFSLAVSKGPDFISRGMVFTETDDMKEARELFKIEGNHLQAFLHRKLEKKEDAKISLKDLYIGYVRFCTDEVVTPLSKIALRERLQMMGCVIKRKHETPDDSAPRCLLGWAWKQPSTAETSVTRNSTPE